MKMKDRGFVGCVYVFKCGKYIKVGMTTLIPRDRRMQFQKMTPYEVKFLYSLGTSHPRKLESELHSLLSNFRHKGEWFVYNIESKKIVKEFLKRYGKNKNG